jgi:MobA-like NTP transferase domain
MGSKIDAMILAGTQNYPEMQLGGRTDHKQFIEICGKTLVEYVIDAALECELLDGVYVVSDACRLDELLAERGFKGDERLRIVPDHPSLTENMRATFYHHILPNAGFDLFDYKRERLEDYLARNPGAEGHEALVMFSDMPFIRAEDITRFIETSDRQADYVVGFADAESMRELEYEAGETLWTAKTKTEMFPFETTLIRSANLFLGKPLRIPPGSWDTAQKIYDNRHLLKKRGEANPQKWKNIVNLFREYVQSQGTGKLTVLNAYAKGLFHFWQFYRAKNRHSTSARLFLGQQDFEQIVYGLTANKAVGRMNICGLARAALDVDNEEMLKRLTANDCELFRRLRNIPRQHPEDPEKALDELVARYDHLFESEEEIAIDEWNRLLELHIDR